MISTLSLTRLTAFAAFAVSSATAAAAAVPVPRELGSLRPYGRPPASQQLRVTLALPLRNRAELDRLIRVQSDRRSPYYHHFLTPRQFAGNYGADDRTVAAAIAGLRAHGFVVRGTNGPRTLVAATAPVASVERAFATSLGLYAFAGRTVYANRTAATLPPDLASLGATVVGLDNVPHARPAHVLGSRRAPIVGPAAHRRMRNGARPFYASGASGGFTPSDLTLAYDYPSRGGNTGSGSTIGIVISNDYLDSDISSWYSSYGVSRTGSLSRVAIDGGGTFDASQSVEVTLDIEQSTSLAPGANELVYEVPDLSNQSILDAYDAVVSANSADVISSSFGGCEQGTSVDGPEDQVFAQGVAQGQTWFASSGDQGSNCYPSNATGVSMPSSDPEVVAVGGTTLSTDASGNYAGESAWSGSGGGVSGEWAIPSYQQGVAGLASSSNRNVPDVALNADPNSGDELIFQGSDTVVGGTSASSPGVAAEFASIVASKGRTGLADTRIYQLGGTSAFHDVTGGSNGAYSAKAGYDDVTGWGSFDGAGLLAAY